MLDQFVELDVSMVTYASFMEKNIDKDEDGYDGGNEERKGGELWKTTNLRSFVNELTIFNVMSIAIGKLAAQATIQV